MEIIAAANVYMHRIPQNLLWYGKCVDWLGATVKTVVVTTQETKMSENFGSALFSDLIETLIKNNVPGICAKIYITHGISACLYNAYYPMYHDISGTPAVTYNVSPKISETPYVGYSVNA